MFRFMICDSDDSFCRREKKRIQSYYEELGIETEIEIFHSMEECMDYIRRKSEEDAGCILISDGKIPLPVEKILYAESRAHRVTYHLLEGSGTEPEYTVYGKLDDIAGKLREFGFCRTHQSYLVNMDYVKEVMRYRAVLLNGTEIQISKKYYKEVQERFTRMRRCI